MNEKVGDSKLMRLAACLVTAASLTANVASATELQFGPGNGSSFWIEAGVEAHVVGVYGLSWSHFVPRGDGFRVFTDSRVVDCEKGSGASAYDHYRCEDYSDFDILAWQGWLQYTPYADVDAYAYAYHLRWDEFDMSFKSFKTCANAVGKDYSWEWVGDPYCDDFAVYLTDALSLTDRLVELYVYFSNYDWYGTPFWGDHCVVCCGYALDTTKPLTDPTCLKGLFIIDPDNDRETNGGRAAAPNTITYCPTAWDEDNGMFAIQGIWGATGYIDDAYAPTPPDDVTPRWTIEVAFNANGGSGSMAAQSFTQNSAQNLTENAFKRFGYAFAGWATSPDGPVVYQDEQSVTFSSSVTLYAVWSEVFAGKVDTSFAKAQTVVGALYTVNGLAGTTQVKFGKISNKRTVKISATASILMAGRAKKVMAKAATVDVDNLQAAVLSFKAPIGDMTLTMGADGTFKLMNATYFMGAATVGGALGGQKTFSLRGFDLAVPGTLLEELLPYAETISVAGTRWQFAKAASVKLVKNRTTNTSDLVVDSSAGKTNLSGLRLTYTAKTGQFKGAFKAYGLSETNGKKKVTKYTVNVIGFVVNGRGSGEASCRRPAGGPWSVTVK